MKNPSALTLSEKAIKKVKQQRNINLFWHCCALFSQITLNLHYLWVGPLQAIVIIVFLWYEIGPSCLAGLAAIALMVPVQTWFGKLFGIFRWVSQNGNTPHYYFAFYIFIWALHICSEQYENKRLPSFIWFISLFLPFLKEQNGHAGRPQNPHHERSGVRHPDHQDVRVGDTVLSSGHWCQKVGMRRVLCVFCVLLLVKHWSCLCIYIWFQVFGFGLLNNNSFEVLLAFIYILLCLNRKSPAVIPSYQRLRND